MLLGDHQRILSQVITIGYYHRQLLLDIITGYNYWILSQAITIGYYQRMLLQYYILSQDNLQVLLSYPDQKIQYACFQATISFLWLPALTQLAARSSSLSYPATRYPATSYPATSCSFLWLPAPTQQAARPPSPSYPALATC